MSVHPVLDFSVNLSACSLNVEGVSLPIVFCAHDHVARTEFETFQALRFFLKFKLPLSHLLFALLIFFEHLEQIFAFIDFSRGISVSDLGEVLHQPEVSSHCICKSSQSTEFWDEKALAASFAIFVHEERLLRIGDRFFVLGCEIVFE